MYTFTPKLAVCVLLSLLIGCTSSDEAHHDDQVHDAHAELEEAEKGSHGGRLLEEGKFAIELAIFESGVPPEYHAWPTLEGKPLPLEQVHLVVELTRLNGSVDRFAFKPQGEYLRGDGVVSEPHSFSVKVSAQHAGQSYSWSYESFEGRTSIASEMAANAGIETGIAGPATLIETLPLYGHIATDPSRQREVTARYPGVIKEVRKQVGERVRVGETLAVVESNESLQSYNVTAPIGGVIAARDANSGEHSADHVLFTIVDSSSVVAELAVFPKDRARVRRGATVQVRLTDSGAPVIGKIDRIDARAGANQSVLARATLDNGQGELLAGSFVTAEVAVSERKVPLAVASEALQPFRDFTVVFEQVGDQYEVRMLELGDQRGEWAEVLGGIEPGARYVTKNSYLIKADIEKSGASHDH